MLAELASLKSLFPRKSLIGQGTNFFDDNQDNDQERLISLATVGIMFQSGKQPFLFFGKNWINTDARKLQASFRTHWVALDVSRNLLRNCVRAGDAPIAGPLFHPPEKENPPPHTAGIFYWPFALFASPACDFVYGAKTNNKQHKREIWYSVNNTGWRERERVQSSTPQAIYSPLYCFAKTEIRQPASKERTAATWLGRVRSKRKLVVCLCLFLLQTKCKLKHNMKRSRAATETKV